ncbi:TRAF3-interacting protein 1 isoform X4 [Anolis sagrei]|uniref:TRAF3-interacting protein 1 isoform X4 n=1 Tax=Anolis sagrei TaxID=38937 RepID=UPI003522B99E
MQGSMVRRTQELLGRVIRKPPLTERLLSKPPFRYLHDVIGEVIRSTGFMKGLYTEAEMKSDNVKDKDAKISFLQKAIDVVIMVTGEPLAVKPARIVAGHEPERTNELLQAIAKCCLNELSSDEAVQKVLAGEKADLKGNTSSSSKSQNKESRSEDYRSHKEGRGDSEIKERGPRQDQKSKEEFKEEESKRKEKESDKPKEYTNHQKNPEKDRFKDREKHEREKTKNRSSKQGRETEKIRDREKGEGAKEEHDKERDRERKQHDGGREKDRLREKDRERERGREKDKEHEKVREKGKDREKDKRKERGRDTEQSREQGKAKDRKATGSEENVIKASAERSEKDKDSAEPDKESENATRLSRHHSTKGPRQRDKPGGEGRKEATKTLSSHSIERTGSILKEKFQQAVKAQEPGIMKANSSAARHADEKLTAILQRKSEGEIAIKQRGETLNDAEGDALHIAASEKIVVSENNEIANESPTQVAQRRLPRPSSARPAPPRIKRQESTDIIVPERNGSAKVVSNVIIDKEDEEDDQFVVEAAPQLPEITEITTEATVELDGDEKHGGLVKKILETKKDYELSQLPKSTEKEKPLLSEVTRKKEKDIVAKEMDKFRGSIQALCRSALPLGKIMDYIQEDVDAMKTELQIWQNENKQLEEALQKEQSITDSVVEPLKAELAELDQLIKDEQDRICAKRANILKNEERIQKMIHNINSRR